MLFTFQGTNISHHILWKVNFEDYCPVSKVGYGSALEDFSLVTLVIPGLFMFVLLKTEGPRSWLTGKQAMLILSETETDPQGGKLKLHRKLTWQLHTVDGRNPTNQLIGSSFPLSTRFYTSQVVQDFFHQQYEMVQKWWKLLQIIRFDWKVCGQMVILNVVAAFDETVMSHVAGVQNSRSKGSYKVGPIGIAKLILHLRYEAGPIGNHAVPKLGAGIALAWR